ncbi:MAG: 1-deoxy-D-xylulose-5-phosphate reductoisomerase [Candidatus Aminicenantes bacterium]|nr:1-deoxy-D-xylulose-5-phosphate reductoisomerase [Candidatus Aminicenantes bacterium]
MRAIAVLGSTGSIGLSTLDVVRRRPKSFRIAALAAGTNLALLAAQIEEFRPGFVSLARPEDAGRLRALLGRRRVEIGVGPEGAEEAASRPEAGLVVSAITGIAGLRPTLAAIRAGKTVALANKESMVVAGAFLRRAASRAGATILPVDSEHSGIFQCLSGQDPRLVRRVILTASGGPFLHTPLARIESRTVRQALRHPRWRMGRKVTIDSATLMNKGLELIEARWLFDIEPARLDVLIHPQSVVHALVEMRDGSVLAQLGPTDMRIPIQYAMTYPDRLPSAPAPLDLAAIGRLEFRSVEEDRFPLFRVARAALASGGTAPAALNAANEAAVEAFLAGRIGFSGIAAVVSEVMDHHRRTDPADLAAVFAADREARTSAAHLIAKRIRHG